MTLLPLLLAQGRSSEAAQRFGMKFSIRDIAVATTTVALMLAFAQIALPFFLIAFGFASIFLCLGPFAILFTSILFAEQRGSFLDISTNPCYRSLKRLWLLSLCCVLVVWGILFVNSAL